jgi:hypothetical protein
MTDGDDDAGAEAAKIHGKYCSGGHIHMRYGGKGNENLIIQSMEEIKEGHDDADDGG